MKRVYHVSDDTGEFILFKYETYTLEAKESRVVGTNIIECMS